MAKYDIRRSLYQIRKAGYNVPKNIRDIVTEEKVKATMARFNVTEREAQRIEIARASTKTIHPKDLNKSLWPVASVTVSGEVYYRAKKGDKLRAAEIKSLLAADARLEEIENKTGIAQQWADVFRAKGNKGMAKIWENRAKKLEAEWRETREAAIGAGLFKSKKLGIPDVDLAKKYKPSDNAYTATRNIVGKSIVSTQARVRHWIKTFRDNMVEAAKHYGLPAYVEQFIINNINRKSIIELDDLSKKDVKIFDILVYFDYARGVNLTNLLRLMKELGVMPIDLGNYTAKDAAAQLATEFNNNLQSGIRTYSAEGIGIELGWYIITDKDKDEGVWI